MPRQMKKTDETECYLWITYHGRDLLGRSIGTRATITDVFFGMMSSGLYAATFISAVNISNQNGITAFYL